VIVKQLSRHAKVAGLVIVLALVAAACGSSSSKSGGSTETTAPKPTGTPLKIGWIGTQTNSTLGNASTQASDAMDAWVKYTNDKGGILGHPVTLFIADDKGDPAVGLAQVKDLVENKGVLAIVGSSAGTTQQTWASYVLEKRIPVVDGSLIDALWFSNPMFYPMGADVIAGIWGMMKAAFDAGAKKAAVMLCTEVAACAQAVPLFEADTKQIGQELVYSALASQTQASYTAECLAAKNKGAEAVAAFVNAIVFSRDCARQGYKPIYISSASGPGRETIKTAPELGNSVGSEAHWPCISDTAPGPIKEFNAAMKKYGHGEWVKGGAKYDQLGSGSCTSWVGGEAFKKAIENAAVAATATATSADVIKGLSMFKEETLGGMAPKITLSDGTKPNPRQLCMWLYKWKDLEYSFLPASGAVTCQPA
jgi:branched-chain amino acid transport system substrate-binding protein